MNTRRLKMSKLALARRIAPAQPKLRSKEQSIVKPEVDPLGNLAQTWKLQSEGKVVKSWFEHVSKGLHPMLWNPPSLDTIDDIEDILSLGNITQLHLGNPFNSPLPPDLIPETVETIYFGDDFNQPVLPGSFPGAKSIKFGKSFDQPLPNGVLPPSLVGLVLDSSYSHPLDPDHLPDGLTIWFNGDVDKIKMAQKRYEKVRFRRF